jgi:hypothetical protein
MIPPGTMKYHHLKQARSGNELFRAVEREKRKKRKKKEKKNKTKKQRPLFFFDFDKNEADARTCNGARSCLVTHSTRLVPLKIATKAFFPSFPFFFLFQKAKKKQKLGTL